MHIIPEWDGTWVRQKVACFKVWGQKTYTRLFERDFRSFSAMFYSIPRMAGASHTTYLLQGEAKVTIRLERANAGARRVGPTTYKRVSRPTTESRPAAHSNFDRSLSLATLSFGHFSSCLEPHHLFAMRFKILLWMLISGPPRWQARIETLSIGRVLYH